MAQVNRKPKPPAKKLDVAEVGAFERRSPEDRIRRTAALIEILELDPDFAAKKKSFEAINLAEGRDFLEETATYDIVILHSIFNSEYPEQFVRMEDETQLSPHHTIKSWKDRLVETEAKYIVVCEGYPFTLSGWVLRDLPGYHMEKRDRWLTVYRRS